MAAVVKALEWGECAFCQDDCETKYTCVNKKHKPVCVVCDECLEWLVNSSSEDLADALHEYPCFQKLVAFHREQRVVSVADETLPTEEGDVAEQSSVSLSELVVEKAIQVKGTKGTKPTRRVVERKGQEHIRIPRPAEVLPPPRTGTSYTSHPTFGKCWARTRINAFLIDETQYQAFVLKLEGLVNFAITDARHSSQIQQEIVQTLEDLLSCTEKDFLRLEPEGVGNKTVPVFKKALLHLDAIFCGKRPICIRYKTCKINGKGDYCCLQSGKTCDPAFDASYVKQNTSLAGTICLTNSPRCLELLSQDDNARKQLNAPTCIRRGLIPTPYTPLMIAAMYGHTKCIQVLLRDDRVDVNYVTQDKSDVESTALRAACFYHQTKSVELLLRVPRIDLYAGNSNTHLLHAVVSPKPRRLPQFTPMYHVGQQVKAVNPVNRRQMPGVISSRSLSRCRVYQVTFSHDAKLSHMVKREDIFPLEVTGSKCDAYKVGSINWLGSLKKLFEVCLSACKEFDREHDISTERLEKMLVGTTEYIGSHPRHMLIALVHNPPEKIYSFSEHGKTCFTALRKTYPFVFKDAWTLDGNNAILHFTKRSLKQLDVDWYSVRRIFFDLASAGESYLCRKNKKGETVLSLLEDASLQLSKNRPAYGPFGAIGVWRTDRKADAVKELISFLKKVDQRKNQMGTASIQ